MKVFNNTVLSEYNEIVNDIKLLSNPVIYIPDGNLGDALIRYGFLKIIEKSNITYQILNIKQSIQQLSKPFDLILCPGGYLIEYYDYSFILNVMKNKNLRCCVILPSSFYNCNDICNIIDDRFIIYCREYQSYQYLKQFSNIKNIKISDDIAIMSDFSKFTNITAYKDTLKSIRGGPEKIQTNLDMSNNIDISRILFTNSRNFNIKQMELYVKIMFDQIGLYNKIITNRLHVAICANKLNRQIELYDNSYHKIKNVYEMSLYKYQNIITHFYE